MPNKRDRVNMVLVRRDREAILDEAKRLEVGNKEVSACGRGRVRYPLNIGAQLLEGLEIVFQILSLAVGVIEGDVIAEWAVEVEGRSLLFIDGEHDISGGRGGRGSGHGGRRERGKRDLGKIFQIQRYHRERGSFNRETERKRLWSLLVKSVRLK